MKIKIYCTSQYILIGLNLQHLLLEKLKMNQSIPDRIKHMHKTCNPNEPQSLNYMSDVCFICKNESNSLVEFKLERFVGWHYCKSCSSNGMMKEALLSYLNKEQLIPFDWFSFKIFSGDFNVVFRTRNELLMTLKDNHDYEDYCNGYESHEFPLSVRLQSINDSILSSNCIMRKTDYDTGVKSNVFSVCVRFSLKAGICIMRVPIANIFAGSPDLYEMMSNADDLLSSPMCLSDIKVCYSDLSDGLKEIITKAEQDGKMIKNSHTY